MTVFHVSRWSQVLKLSVLTRYNMNTDNIKFSATANFDMDPRIPSAQDEQKKNLNQFTTHFSTMSIGGLLPVSLHSLYVCVLMLALCHDTASGLYTTQAGYTSSNSSSALTTSPPTSANVVNTSLSTGPTTITAVSQSLVLLSSNSCRIGVLAPFDLHSYGLGDNVTFNTTLASAESAAQSVLGSTCVVDVHVIRTRCTLSATLRAAFTHLFDVLIGPPCSARKWRLCYNSAWTPIFLYGSIVWAFTEFLTGTP